MARSRNAGLSDIDLKIVRDRLRLAKIEVGGEADANIYVTVMGAGEKFHRLIVKEHGMYRLLDRNGDVVHEADEIHTLLDKVM
jgi:hypothetical protein